MSHMTARKLENAFTTKCMLQGLLASGAVRADECALASRLTTFGGEHTVALFLDPSDWLKWLCLIIGIGSFVLAFVTRM